MAKKKAFGAEGAEQKAAQQRMAKVIVSTKSARNKFAFKETMVAQDSVQDFIKQNKS